MKEDELKLCIVGLGGFAREVLLIAKTLYDLNGIDYKDEVVFLVKDEEWSEVYIMGIPQVKESDFNPEIYKVVIGIGNPKLKNKIVEKLPKNTIYTNLIHPNADISSFVTLGKGVIIASRVILTCNISIGNHAVIDRNTSIGHDCKLNNYSHIAPSVVLSGNVNIGKFCYLGTGALIKEGISVIDNTIIGMGAVVVKDIIENGTFVGNPARRLY